MDSQKKELPLQKRAKQHEQLKKQSAATFFFKKSLDIKECMLEIQPVILGKLVTEKKIMSKT
jgi:hypothetical protein